MKLALPAGTSSYLIRVFIQDTTSTVGAGKSGLTYASITWYYSKVGQSGSTAVTAAAGTLGTWTSGGFVAVDATNMPGVYEIGVPNACLSGNTVHMTIAGSGFFCAPIEIQTDNMPMAAGPTAVAIRTEMDSNSTKLANLDATVSSRLATSGYTAPTTPPTANAIAAQVMTSLGTGSGLTSLAQASQLAADLTTLAGDITAAVATLETAISAGGSGGEISGFSSSALTALTTALRGLSLGVFSSTIQLPDGSWLVQVTQGDDHLVSNGNPLGNFVVPDAALVGTTAFLALHFNDQPDVVTVGIEVTEIGQVLPFELPSGVSANMSPGQGRCSVRFVKSSPAWQSTRIFAAAICYPRFG